MNKDIAIMYHYVRNKSEWIGSVPIEVAEFRAQVEWAAKNYEIVTPDDLGKKSSKPKCVLSFDDATKDQYYNAFEMLTEMGIPAYFTVMSGPLVEKKIPIFHLVHTILSNFSDEEIWKELNACFDIPDLTLLSDYYQYEPSIYRRYNKYVFNFLWSENQSRKFLEGKLFELYGSTEKFIEDFYISKGEFLKMKASGMSIGVHCVNHLPYGGEAQLFYENEIEPCARFIKNELGITPRWYTPAFGGGENTQQMISQLEPILKSNNFIGAFTTVQGYNNGHSSFWLNRIDCNKLYPIV
ncbi:polysaccharide deacetylase family protein [Psychrobacillus sp. NPDC096623]|uniref:polysaccharide deacetylase family protein n=1 Tax=Psychrobacillus sp. NPDC096623 TaxID=3364492 RepID=UPI0037F779ED